jgi:hypothetical protein
MANEPELTYDRAFPGRFIKAGILDGRNITLAIESAFMEVLEGDKGKENKLILTFVGKTLQLVCNKSNALCLREMFGSKISVWVGKRVIFYPTRVAFGPKQVDAIRVFGSPDIAADIEVAARVGRKNFKATMRRIATGGDKAVVPVAEPASIAPVERDDEGRATYFAANSFAPGDGTEITDDDIPY